MNENSKTKRPSFKRTEKKLSERELNLDRKVDILDKKEKDYVVKEKNLLHREPGIGKREKELEQLLTDQNKQLERIAGMSAEEAKRVLMDNLIGQAKMESAATVKEIKEKAEAARRRRPRRSSSRPSIAVPPITLSNQPSRSCRCRPTK